MSTVTSLYHRAQHQVAGAFKFASQANMGKPKVHYWQKATAQNLKTETTVFQAK